MSMQVPPANQSVVGKLLTEFNDFRERHAKDESLEGDVFIHPFATLDKMQVMLDSRAFHNAAFVRMHPKRCCQQLTKLLWFLTQGENMGGSDSVDMFFGVTKLFQSVDPNLRRLVYLFLRSVADTTDRSSLIIVTQSLVKDMVNEAPLFKGNALRVLGAIVDTSMLGQLDRYFLQMLVDKDDYVASTTLTTAWQLMRKPGAADTISRWTNEVQTVLTTRSDMVQYHALALLGSIKRHDRLAVSKVVQTLMKGSFRSPLGQCLLIRYAQSLLEADPSVINTGALYEYLESCCRSKSEMVVFEAARAMCSMPAMAGRDLSPAITMLHMFLASPKPALRFAAVRTLHKLAAGHPGVVSKCNDDLEVCIADTNRSVATYAITTLLKTGSDASVDRLMRQISSFMGEVGSDELKVTVVQAIHELALRMPAKHRTIMTFLSNALREEGGYDYKKAILDALLDIMAVIPESQGEGLMHLCEFIEDCEFTSLATRVLHLLGDQGPSAPHPSTFIRYIYNRVILENAQVRASAVTALAKFATRCPDLRPSILPLLQRCLDDDDDEVRDRATLYVRMLGGETTVSTVATPATTTPAITAFAAPLTHTMTAGFLPLPIVSLGRALTLYAQRPPTGPFSFDALPHVEAPTTSALASPPAATAAGFGYTSEIRAAEAAAAAAKIAKAKARLTTPASAGLGSESTRAGSGGGTAGAGASGGDASSAADALYRVPEFAKYGGLFRSSKPLELTEAELEYLVTVQKHIFNDHIVFQFTIRNTVGEMVLERAAVAMTCSDPTAFTHAATIAAPKVKHGTPATAFVAWARVPEAGITSASFSCELRFSSREVDPATGEALSDPTPEVYPLDGLDVTPADFVAAVPVPDPKATWDTLGPEGEALAEFALPGSRSVAETVASVIEAVGLAPCAGSGAVAPGATKHNAYLAGVFLGNLKVVARMQVALASVAGGAGAGAGGSGSGCTLKLGIRSDDKDVSQLLLDCVS